MDYFAWLFNSRVLTAPGADRLWGPVMVCEWNKIFVLVYGRTVATRYFLISVAL